ncbi:hypothetical protein COT40_00840 [Candidatus Peregrinibacteria bacterium CG08_land_8_20_14_0_20_41_10]|nr:MAG: hypothetical protein COT40_00840 [Candidatus Peregrinibacteria bacterium CG08_land_8_20_14_0_20_41_10]
MRIAKFIAECGVCSRRKAEELILAGKVKVNDQVISSPALNINPEQDKVYLDSLILSDSGQAGMTKKQGQTLTVPGRSDPVFCESRYYQITRPKKLYLALHKPAGYTCTLADRFADKKVIDLIPQEYKVFPVGRLDKDTEGLLFLTNDGDWAYRVTHPKFEHEKEYLVILAKPRNLHFENLNKIEQGLPPYSPAQIKNLKIGSDKITLNLVIHEGKNRQIREMFRLVGYRVIYLRRVRIGSIKLSNLPLGKWRLIQSDEVKQFNDGL